MRRTRHPPGTARRQLRAAFAWDSPRVQPKLPANEAVRLLLGKNRLEAPDVAALVEYGRSLGLTVIEMARRAGIHHQTLYTRQRRGSCNPDVTRALAELYGVEGGAA